MIIRANHLRIMSMHRKASWVAVCLAAVAAIHAAECVAAETNDLPHFQEIFRLLRANLSDVTEEDLNRAAVQGLLTRYYPRVILVTNDSSAGAAAEAPLVSQVNVYDK